jgi:hypothetical protein
MFDVTAATFGAVKRLGGMKAQWEVVALMDASVSGQ